MLTASVVVIATVMFLIEVKHSAAAPDLQASISQVYITDVRDRQFVVSGQQTPHLAGASIGGRRRP